MVVAGSRVRLSGLKTRPELNGREGRVAGIATDSGRALVELEAYTGAILRVKPSCAPEAPTPSSRAPVSRGVLGLVDAETFNMIIDNARFCTNVISGFKIVPEAHEPADIHRLRLSGGLEKLQRLSSGMYGAWTKGHGQYSHGVMSMLYEV